jgi:hypothetical protein
MSDTPRLIPLPRWNEFHPAPSVAGMRWIRFNAESNGFAPAFKTIGRSVFVDEREFFACVERTNAKRKPKPMRRMLRVPRPVATIEPA